ncbi:MAG: D-glycero-beta-D-manno-heptose-7-phosphate kinase [Proteobacteria bacterium]|nr:D-glycero-beta-D-manno-heptose-7-phosphate kinase [Pseudomonadota bacterium]
MPDLDATLRRVAGQTVLCVGDLMLDVFVYGEVSRISPEAPTPVIAVRREDRVIGGAGNVARNIAGLGAKCLFVGVIGDDDGGRVVADDVAKLRGLIEAGLVVDRTRPTTRKVRFVSEHHSTHLIRADWEEPKPLDAATEAGVLAHLESMLPRAGAVIISDYAKGVLTPRVVRTTIERARAAGRAVIVDPKGAAFARYRGASVITPNRGELAQATHLPVGSISDVATAARVLFTMVDCHAVLVTLSEDGLLLQERDADPVHVPAYPVRVRDVSGAGDTVAAVLAAMLAAGASYEDAVRATNAAAAVVVGKRGTATVAIEEMRAQLLPRAALALEDKVTFDPAVLEDRLRDWRARDLRIGFTNGCFDLLHPGHVHLLTKARAACDRLVVGLNSDASVRRLKGAARPIQDVAARAQVLAALEAVDLVAVFEEDTPLELIRRVRPNVLVKGADYRREDVVGRDIVEGDGGAVVIAELIAGHSTSTIVRRSRSHPPPGDGAP